MCAGNDARGGAATPWPATGVDPGKPTYRSKPSDRMRSGWRMYSEQSRSKLRPHRASLCKMAGLGQNCRTRCRFRRTFSTGGRPANQGEAVLRQALARANRCVDMQLAPMLRSRSGRFRPRQCAGLMYSSGFYAGWPARLRRENSAESTICGNMGHRGYAAAAAVICGGWQRPTTR